MLYGGESGCWKADCRLGVALKVMLVLLIVAAAAWEGKVVVGQNPREG